MTGDGFETHSAKGQVQLFRLGMGEFDEFEPVGSGGIVQTDPGFRGVMREGSHGVSLRRLS